MVQIFIVLTFLSHIFLVSEFSPVIETTCRMCFPYLLLRTSPSCRTCLQRAVLLTVWVHGWKTYLELIESNLLLLRKTGFMNMVRSLFPILLEETISEDRFCSLRRNISKIQERENSSSKKWNFFLTFCSFRSNESIVFVHNTWNLWWMDLREICWGYSLNLSF